MIQYSYLPGPWWIIGGGVLVAALIVASYLCGKGRSSRGLRLVLSAIRWSVIAGVIFCLFDPEWLETIKHQQKSRVAVLLDTSRSMSIKDLPQDRLTTAKTWL